MSPRLQLRLLLSLAALATALALIGLVAMQRDAAADVSVETAYAYMRDEAPDRLDLKIHLRNDGNRDTAVIGVAAPRDLAAQLCFAQPHRCGGVGAGAALGPKGELVLGADGAAFVSLASGGRPFREGEIALIQLMMEDGDLVPVDLMVQRR